MASVLSSQDEAHLGGRVRVQSRGRLVGGSILIALGLLIPLLMQWSISSLADELALDIAVSEPLRAVDHSSANSPFGSAPLASARVVTRSGQDPLPELRQQLRAQGFALTRSGPEAWFQPRADSYDATVFTLSPGRDSSGGSYIEIEAQTFDDDARILFVPALVLSLVLLVGGTLVGGTLVGSARGAGRPGRPGPWRAVVGASAVLTFALPTTIALRALHQARQLINAHVAAHAPLPDDLYGLGSIGTPAERLLSNQLCVVSGLYPFGVLWALVPLALAFFSLSRLFPGGRRRNAVLGLGAIAFLVVLVLYVSTGSVVSKILE